MTADLDRPGALPEGPSSPEGGLAPQDALAPEGTPVPAYAAADRPRGLDSFFPPGGEDEAPPERVKDERRLTRLLVVMVVLLVGIPTLITLVAFVGQLLSLRAGG